MELTAGLTNVVTSPGLLTSLILCLLTLVQVCPQPAQPLGVAWGGAVARAGLTAGATDQPLGQALPSPHVQGGGGECGVQGVHLHVDVAAGPVTGHWR